MIFPRHLKWWIFLGLCTRTFAEGHFKLCLHIKHTCVYLPRKIRRKISAFDLSFSFFLSLLLAFLLSFFLSFLPLSPVFLFFPLHPSLLFFFPFVFLFLLYLPFFHLSLLLAHLPACSPAFFSPFISLILHPFLLLFFLPNLPPPFSCMKKKN